MPGYSISLSAVAVVLCWIRITRRDGKGSSVLNALVSVKNQGV